MKLKEIDGGAPQGLEPAVGFDPNTGKFTRSQGRGQRPRPCNILT